MSRLAAIVVTGLLFLLAGCATSKGLQPLGKVREPSQLAAKHLFSNVAVSPAAWPKSDWWHAFGDPQLDALIGEALQNSPSLDDAEARVRLALAEAGVEDAARKPSLAGNVSAIGIRIPSSVAPDPIGGHYSTLNALTLKFSYGFDLWGGKRAAWEAAVDQAHAAEVDAQAARLTLVANIVRSYAALDYAFVQADVAQRELERATGVFDLTGQRVKAGIDNTLQLKQAEAALPVARQQLLAAQLQITTARVALAALLGAGPDRGLAIERPQALQLAALALPSALPAELLGRRPDIVAARWRSEAAAREIKVAETQFLPNFDLSATVGLASIGLSELFTAQSRYYQVAPALTLPIFAGGRLRANLSGKDAQYDLAVAHYNQTLVDAVHAIAADLATLRSLDAQAAAVAESRATSRAAFDLAMQRYRGGIGNYLEALAVQQQYLDSEQRAAALHAQQVESSIQLIADLGGGYSPERPDPNAPEPTWPDPVQSNPALPTPIAAIPSIPVATPKGLAQ